MMTKFLFVFLLFVIAAEFSFAGKGNSQDVKAATLSMAAQQALITHWEMVQDQKAIHHERTNISKQAMVVRNHIGNFCQIVTSYSYERAGAAVISYKNYDLVPLQKSTLLPNGNLFILIDL